MSLKTLNPAVLQKQKLINTAPPLIHVSISSSTARRSQCRLRQQSLRDADPAAHPEAASLRRPRGGRRPDLRGCLAGKVPRVFYVVGKMSAS